MNCGNGFYHQYMDRKATHRVYYLSYSGRSRKWTPRCRLCAANAKELGYRVFPIKRTQNP